MNLQQFLNIQATVIHSKMIMSTLRRFERCWWTPFFEKVLVCRCIGLECLLLFPFGYIAQFIYIFSFCFLTLFSLMFSLSISLLLFCLFLDTLLALSFTLQFKFNSIKTCYIFNKRIIPPLFIIKALGRMWMFLYIQRQENLRLHIIELLYYKWVHGTCVKTKNN